MYVNINNYNFLRFQNGVQHFKVLRDGGGKYFIWVKKFDSINMIVNHHREVTVSRSHEIFFKDMVNHDLEVITRFQFFQLINGLYYNCCLDKVIFRNLIL